MSCGSGLGPTLSTIAWFQGCAAANNALQTPAGRGAFSLKARHCSAPAASERERYAGSNLTRR